MKTPFRKGRRGMVVIRKNLISKRNKLVKYSLLSAAAVMAALHSQSAFATTYVWTGAAPTTWDATGTNWNNGSAGQVWSDNVANIAQFDAPATAGTITIATGVTRTTGGINFNTSNWIIAQGNLASSRLTTGNNTRFTITLRATTTNTLRVGIYSTTT